MRVLIAGKQAALRSALKTLLQTRPGIEIVGLVSDKKDLFVQLNTKIPDLLLLDEELDQNLVVEVIVPIQKLAQCPLVVVLGGRSESSQVFLDAGVVAFINKSDSPKSLLTAIEEIRLRRKRV